MEYKATKSFTGKISMAVGEVRDIPDKTLAKELLRAGYIIEMKADKPVKRKKGE